MELAKRHCRQLINIFIIHRNCQRFQLQPSPAAELTGCNPHIFFILCLCSLRIGFPVTLLHVFHKPLKRHRIDAFPPLSFIMHFHFFSARTRNQHLPDLRRKFPPGRIHTETVFRRQRLQQRMRKASLILAGLPPHYLNRAAV